MRTILFIIRKEFLQIKRNRMMLPVIFVVPIIQMLILVNAATLEMKNISVCVVDNDLSSTSRNLINKFNYSPFFKITKNTQSIEDAKQQMALGKAQMIIQIPPHFEKDLIRQNSNKVQVLMNAINGTVAGIGSMYAQQIISGYNSELISKWAGAGSLKSQNIQTIPRFWYNPGMNYKIYMVPAILVILVTIIGMLLATLNIVREKELGTIEQINVTPIKKIHFIIGKLLPFWIIALVMLSFGLFIGKLAFNIPFNGNLGLLFFVACIYLVVVQGFGLLLSNSSANQQQALFLGFFFMIVFVLMSGVFTPADSMPMWGQWINKLNPIAYFMRLIRMILLKGSAFSDVYKDILTLFIYGIVLISLATWRYKKVSS